MGLAVCEPATDMEDLPKSLFAIPYLSSDIYNTQKIVTHFEVKSLTAYKSVTVLSASVSALDIHRYCDSKRST